MYAHMQRDNKPSRKTEYHVPPLFFIILGLGEGLEGGGGGGSADKKIKMFAAVAINI